MLFPETFKLDNNDTLFDVNNVDNIVVDSVSIVLCATFKLAAIEVDPCNIVLPETNNLDDKLVSPNNVVIPETFN